MHVQLNSGPKGPRFLKSELCINLAMSLFHVQVGKALARLHEYWSFAMDRNTMNHDNFF